MPVLRRAIKALASFLLPLPPALALFLSLSSQPLIVSEPKPRWMLNRHRSNPA